MGDGQEATDVTDSTVYVLGAGASAEAGVPQTKSLLDLVDRRSTDSKELARFIKRFGFRNAKEGSIQDLINFVNSCVRDNQPLDGDFTIDKLRALRNVITVQLSFVIGEASKNGDKVRLPEGADDQLGAKELRLPLHFRRFVRKLRTRRRGIAGRLAAGDVVVSTNYDINIDAALYELVYADETGAERDGSQLSDVYLGSTEFRDPYTDEYALSSAKATVDLLKLHGSLNWLYCPRCMRIFVAAFGFSVRYLADLNDPETLDERTCFCGYHPLEVVIVAPSSTQEIANLHLRSIWLNAYKALEASDHIVICGYSLPPEDLAIRSLFHRSLDARRQMGGKTPTVRVIDPKAADEQLRDRFVRLFGSDVRFIEKEFGAWVKDDLG